MLYIKWINDSSEQFFPYQIIYYEWRNWTFVGLWKIWIKYLLLWGYTAPKTQMSVIISFTGENLDVTAEQMIFVVQTTWRQADLLLRPEGGLPRILKEIPWKKIVGRVSTYIWKFWNLIFFFQFQEQVHS